MSVITIHHLIATLKMPDAIGDKIQRLQTIKSSLTSSTHFSAARWALCPITLLQYGNSVTDLVDAETLVTTQRGQSGNRNTKLGVAKTNAETIMHSLVQATADDPANVANAETIILSGGYFVRATAIHLPRINAAYNSEILGTVILTAETDGHTEWFKSKDKVTITQLPSTSGNHTKDSGFTTGDVWYFCNHKVNTTKVTYGMSAWIELKIGAGGKNVGTSAITGHGGGLPTT
ncbi:MAG: hypothetical protein ACYDCN_04715 [Bacteroidia bacterium]